MEAGLFDRRDSLDLLQDLDFGIMDLGTSAEQRECNDIMDTIGRKDSGGGDEGQGGGVSGGSSGDGAAAAGTGSNGGGGNAEASTPEGDGIGSFGTNVDGVLLDCTAWALGDDGSIALGDGVAHKRVHRPGNESATGESSDCGNNSGGAVSHNVADAGAAAATAGGVTCASGRGPNAAVEAGPGAGAGGNGDGDREIDVSAEVKRGGLWCASRYSRSQDGWERRRHAGGRDGNSAVGPLYAFPSVRVFAVTLFMTSIIPQRARAATTLNLFRVQQHENEKSTGCIFYSSAVIRGHSSTVALMQYKECLGR